jgi:hypothetical protein
MDTNEFISKAAGGSLSQQEAYAALMGFAKQQKERGQSDAQAFSSYITKDETGRRLFRAYRDIPGGEFDTTKADPMKPALKQAPVQKDDDVEWGALVKAYAKSYSLSDAKAIDQIMLTAEGRKLFRATMKRERMRDPNYSENDYAFLDACDAQRDADYELHKANAKTSEFMDLVNQMRSKFPAMTLSDAMERTQSLYPEAWRKYREMDVKANPADPNAAPLSGKPTPSRAPNWQGEQTSSELTPPRKFPVADDTVRFKSAEAATAEANFAFFTKILYDASAKAGRPWSVEKCIATLRQCPAAAQYFDAAVAA